MYSVVILAALTASADAPDFGHKRHGCHGCYGSCYGGCYGSCYGSCYGGCYGSCYGGYSSCYGGCYGGYSSCYGGCYGGYSGCYGGGWSCGGCYGGYSGCWGSSCYGGCYGGYSGCWGSGCSGWSSGYGCCGGGVVVPGAAIGGAVPSTPAKPDQSEEAAPAPKPETKVGGVVEQTPQEKQWLKEMTNHYEDEDMAAAKDQLNKQWPTMSHAQRKARYDDFKKNTKKEGKPKDEGKEISAPALLVVNLPADAQLAIEGAATTSTSARRVFVSPALERGKLYHYTLEARVVRDGRPVTLNKVVDVRAGATTQVTLQMPAGAPVASR